MTRSLRALLASLVLIGVFAICGGVRGSHAAGGAFWAWADAEQVVCQYDWPCDEAMRIAWRESRLDAHAYNPAYGAAGWFQIIDAHGYSLSTRFDPEENTRIAYGLYLASGWAPWEGMR